MLQVMKFDDVSIEVALRGVVVWWEVAEVVDLEVEWEVDHQEWEVEVVHLEEVAVVDIFLLGI